MDATDLCDSAVFVTSSTLCVRERFVTWVARNVLTEICEAWVRSKICQQLCRLVSPGDLLFDFYGEVLQVLSCCLKVSNNMHHTFNDCKKFYKITPFCSNLFSKSVSVWCVLLETFK